MLMDEIQEIGELIAPKLFGKPYVELGFTENFAKLKTSELFHCCAEAQLIRLQALQLLKHRSGKTYGDVSWPELLLLCKEVIEQPGRLEQQKKTLRQRGYLQ